MTIIKYTTLIIICVFTLSANAKYYIYDASDKSHIHGNVDTLVGWNYALKAFVNKEVEKWSPADVVEITNRSTVARWYYHPFGHWLPATNTQIAEAKTDGTVILRVIIVVQTDPLIIDLGQDGFHFSKNNVGVNFDFVGNNQTTHVQWLRQNGNDAFLALDFNNNGIIDNGTELFGNYTTMLTSGELATNGFEALSQFDNFLLGGNNDGLITQEDEIWPSLTLWLDINADGICDYTEMYTLSDFNLIELNITAKENNRNDPAGNWLPLWSWVKNGNTYRNNKHKMVDVFFKVLD